MNQLKINNLSKSFGGIQAIKNFNMTVDEHEKIGIIGPNGAGKTTLFNCLTGLYPLTEGEILYTTEDKSITLNNYSVDKITNLGFSRTFQNIRLFDSLSVLDNVKVAFNRLLEYGMIDSVLRTRKFYLEERMAQEKALEYLEITDLREKANDLASSLSYGEQRRLEIARALATGAKFLFLDEPAAGMNPQETHDLTEFINYIHKKFSLTIVLIEHDMNLVMKVCDRIYVLNYGEGIADGTPSEIQNNQKVIDAYLGGDDNA